MSRKYKMANPEGVYFVSFAKSFSRILFRAITRNKRTGSVMFDMMNTSYKLALFGIFILFTIACGNAKKEDGLNQTTHDFFEHSKLLRIDSVSSINCNFISLVHRWNVLDRVLSHGRLCANDGILTIELQGLFRNSFDIINPSIFEGDTLTIHWNFLPNDSNFIKKSFRIYKNKHLSWKYKYVVTLDSFGLMEIGDSYHLVFSADNEVIGEFVTIKPKDNGKTYVIHKEGIVPQILSNQSEYTHKRIL